MSKNKKTNDLNKIEIKSTENKMDAKLVEENVDDSHKKDLINVGEVESTATLSNQQVVEDNKEKKAEEVAIDSESLQIKQERPEQSHIEVLSEQAEVVVIASDNQTETTTEQTIEKEVSVETSVEETKEQSLKTEIKNAQTITDNQKSFAKADVKIATTNPPVSTMLKLYSGHFGKILSNISIVAAFLTILSLFVIFLPVIYIFIAILIVVFGSIFTFGLIYVVYPNFLTDVFGFGEQLALIIEKIMYMLPVFAGISLSAAALSILFLALDRTQNHSVRITTSAVMLGLSVLVVVLVIAGVVSAA